ncbi:CubicO group peptidase (beta-lactamase class C family) [Pseudonocardia hierapolitana]|uniref:CubicO group peptidase (Beta-lactamase class C family) n=1 Tax=Pseudonocardia hierapolitana TaxID=1128676 RepID=A0A561SLW4_9PSEU|nr:serine hydrolase domain-containing protein [Pseudonocardia hierapolitana]TWF75854.1 CubicO group peptidase (beta-lactamase class C family) [Pseudonocardia hierapolitana]
MSEERLAAAVDALLDELVGSGAEAGLQVAVIRHGRTLVDAARGVADPRTAAPVEPGTLFWAGSTAKGVAATVAHVLVERGGLTDDLRVAEVWPEFGAHGKDAVTLRQVLMHTAGVPNLPPDTSAADLCDWDRMCAVVADAKPCWEPGTRFGYHAKTFGFLLGETLRRATGEPISALLRTHVTGPLGVADEVHFGVPRALLPRVARQVGSGSPRPDPGSALARAMPPGVVPDPDYANRPDLLTSDIPAEGTMSARGVARIYAALLGPVDGVALVSAARRTAIAEIAFEGTDEVMGFPASLTYGYSPFRPSGRGRPGSTFGWVGANGSAAFGDIDSGVAVAVMRNRFGDFATAARIDQLIVDELA